MNKVHRGLWAVLLLCTAADTTQAALNNAFTYQGSLRLNGAAVTGSYDFQFELYLDAAAATPISSAPVDVGDVGVDGGLFSAKVDFGNAQFWQDQPAFLEIRVRPGASTGAYTVLTPRQEITPTPFAQHAADVRDYSINAAKIVPSQVQARVSGKCPNGSPVVEVFESGAVKCDSGSAGVVESALRTTLDSVGNVGDGVAMVLAADGLPSIAYYDASNGDLKYLHCANARCSSSTKVVVDSAGIVGAAPSIANGVDQNLSPGAINMTYYDQTNSALKNARCSNASCSSVELRSIDATGNVGIESSVHLNGSGNIIAAYRDTTNSQLLYARCGSTGCISVGAINVVDNAGNVGSNPLLLTGPGNDRVMVYTDLGTNTLKFARCTSADCSAPVVSTLGAASLRGDPIAMAIGSNGFPLIAATDANGTIHILSCTSATCAAYGDSNLGLGPAGKISMAVGPDGIPVLAYYYSTNQDLRYVRCRNSTCAGGNAAVNEVILESTNDVGSSLAIIAPPDGNPAIAYYDATTGDLDFIKCPNQWCAAYFGAK